MSWYNQFKEEKILVCTEDEHNKFWAAHWDPTTNQVHVRWGRLGTKGQSQVKKFGHTSAAVNFISSKYSEKQGKGYTNKDGFGNIIDHARFEMMCIEAAIVGSQNKCHEFKWLKLIDFDDNKVNKWQEVTIDALSNPEITPGIMVTLETKKEYNGNNQFKLIFTPSKTYDVNSQRYVTSGHPLRDLADKVAESIGRSLG